MALDEKSQTSPQSPPVTQKKGFLTRFNEFSEQGAHNVFILPAVLVILFLSIFPLLISLYLSLSQFKFVKGGFELNFVGLKNFQKLFLGSQQSHFLGVFGHPSLLGWVVFFVLVVLMLWGIARYIRSGHARVAGLIGRIIGFFFGCLVALLVLYTLSDGGRPGTVVVTWIYVFVGIAIQYTIGLGLALLVTQQLPGRRFFRVVFLIPMMITPVGVAYLFRMLTDTDKGPFQPIWQAMGLGLYSWVTDPWGARSAIMIGDIWQWVPFMFIVLLAALEGQSTELIEAALVDGASRFALFWYITLPQILPVTFTLVLIRMIESFKIIDLPNVLTNGGPGTATESLTLHAYINWRALDLGGSAAVAYSLLFIVTFMGIAYVNLLRGRAAEA